MASNGNEKPGVDRDHLAALVRQFKALEADGAANGSHTDHEKRNEVLDELQDLVGLAGRMVMERDILRKAEQLLGPCVRDALSVSQFGYKPFA
jgi:hypothetical protein